MKIIDPGHEYIAESIGGWTVNQRITFVKNRGEKYPGNTGDPHPGVLCQELIRILIDRVVYLNGQGPCAETEHALAALRLALAWMEVRAARCRGDVIDLSHADDLERSPTYPICGHAHYLRGNAASHERLPGTWR